MAYCQMALCLCFLFCLVREHMKCGTEGGICSENKCKIPVNKTRLFTSLQLNANSFCYENKRLA